MNLRIRIGRWISGDQKRINSYLSNIALLQDQLSKAKDDLLKVNEQLDSIAGSVQTNANQEAEIERLENRNTDLCMENNTLKANSKAVKEQLDKALESESKLKADNDQLRENLKKALENADSLKKQNGTLRAELKDVKSKCTKIIRTKKLSSGSVTTKKNGATNEKQAAE